MGDSDYFPNGGSDQPQCYGCSYCISENHCSSEEAVWYYIDSISTSPCVFVACASLDGNHTKPYNFQRVFQIIKAANAIAVDSLTVTSWAIPPSNQILLFLHATCLPIMAALIQMFCTVASVTAKIP